jgi:hypothetical protein
VATKPRGAQPGNTNALKHGFYARKFTHSEHLDLESVGVGIDSEVAMLRVATRRMFDLANGEHDLESMIHITGALGQAATRLAGLLRTQKLLGGDDNSSVIRAISEAVAEVVQEMNLR